MNFGDGHWVSIVVCLPSASITVLDPNTSRYDQKEMDKILEPLVILIPALISQVISLPLCGRKLPQRFDISRHDGVSQSKRACD